MISQQHKSIINIKDEIISIVNFSFITQFTQSYQNCIALSGSVYHLRCRTINTNAENVTARETTLPWLSDQVIQELKCPALCRKLCLVTTR